MFIMGCGICLFRNNSGKMRKKRIVLLIGVIGIITAGFFVFLREYNASRIQKETRFMLGAYVTIYAPGDRHSTLLLIKGAMDRMQEIDTKFNPHNPDSPIYQFNHNNVPISDPEIISVIQTALEVGRRSEGAFDITTFALTELWGFDTDSPHLPQEARIKEVLEDVGLDNILIEDAQVSKKKTTVMIGMGGIAQGYAVREAIRFFKEKGVKSALVDVSGDIYALGKKNNSLWKVGIRDPKSKDILGYVEVEDMAITAAGDYERFFIEDGKRYHHIFNPKTGYPSEGLASVTIICPDPMLADAWDTALFALGADKAMEVAKTIQGIEVIMITSSGQILYSPGMKNGMKLIPKPL